MLPRPNRISKQDVNMLHALSASFRSPDPNTQVGAAVINPSRNKLISTGYNGWPRGIASNALPWDRKAESILDVKYTYVVHAEKNAIVNANCNVDGFSLYVTMYPCNECAKDIIQAGIKEIVYLSNPYKDLDITKASVKMFEMLDIKTRQHKWNAKITLPYLQYLNQTVSQQ